MRIVVLTTLASGAAMAAVLIFAAIKELSAPTVVALLALVCVVAVLWGWVSSRRRS